MSSHGMRSLALRVLTSNALAVVIASTIIGPVLASNFGSNTASGGTPAHACDATVNSQCIADNWTHTVYVNYMTSSSAMWNATLYAVSHYNAVADVSVVLTTSSSRDVNVIQVSHGDTEYWAYSTCDEAATKGGSDPNRLCKPQWILYNMTHPFPWDNTTLHPSGRDTVACHEMGHTLGLRHVPNATTSCMDSAQTTEKSINQHDKDELNAQYYPY